MTRLGTLLPLLAAALLLSGPVCAQEKSGEYCATHTDEPGCYCPTHADELKCLRFFGSNPGFSSSGAGTSATFNSGGKVPDANVSTKSPAEQLSRYTLFIHSGAPPDVTAAPDVSTLVKKFKDDGYVVRGTDDQRDERGGSGIDYFRLEDEDAAEAIAKTVNAWLKANGKGELAVLKERRQLVRNPPGYIGVWIFGHPKRT
jgi:hypothetical protein